MRLLSILDTKTQNVDEHTFRTSGTSALIVFITSIAITSGVTGSYLWSYFKNEASGWLSIGVIWVAFWSFIFAWIAWSRFKSTVLPSNWLLRMSPARVLVKFRSFQNYAYPETDFVVIELYWKEISWVRKTKETSHKDKGDTATTEFFTYLDIRLDLNETEYEKLKNGLNNERKRKPLRSSLGDLKHELFKARKNKAAKHEIDYIKDKINQEKAIKSQNNSKSSAKYHDYPVRLVHDNILRVRWNSISPNIKNALALFSEHSKIEDEIKFITDSSRDDLSGKALDDMILERISQGDKFDAIRLVKRHYGYGTNEAMKFIDELTGKK